MPDEELGADRLSEELEVNRIMEAAKTVKIAFFFITLLQVLQATVIIQPFDIPPFYHTIIQKRAFLTAVMPDYGNSSQPANIKRHLPVLTGIS